MYWYSMTRPLCCVSPYVMTWNVLNGRGLAKVDIGGFRGGAEKMPQFLRRLLRMVPTWYTTRCCIMPMPDVEMNWGCWLATHVSELITKLHCDKYSSFFERVLLAGWSLVRCLLSSSSLLSSTSSSTPRTTTTWCHWQALSSTSCLCTSFPPLQARQLYMIPRFCIHKVYSDLRRNAIVVYEAVQSQCLHHLLPPHCITLSNVVFTVIFSPLYVLRRVRDENEYISVVVGQIITKFNECVG